MLRNLLSISKRHFKLNYSTYQCNTKRLFSRTQYYNDVSGSSQHESKTSDDKNEEISEMEEKRKYNPKALIDLCIEEFDDDLLYFPEVLDKDRWVQLVDFGSEVEETLSYINYKEFLSTGQLSNMGKEKLKSLKLFGLQIPQKYGGLGLMEVEAKYIREIVGVYPSIARLLAENEEMGVKSLIKYGTEEQKQKYLPKLASGESMISFAFLEASTPVFDHASCVGLEAFQADDKFVLNGRKKWVYNANNADVLLVHATHPVRDGDGIFLLNSIFIVDRNTEGLRVNKPMEKQWLKGVDVCEVVFDEIIVGKDNMLGGMGNGFEIIYDALKNQRTGTISECSALLKRLVHDAIVKCKGSEFTKQPVEALQYSHIGLSQLSSIAYAVESLAYYVAARTDYYQDPDYCLEIFIAKIYAAEALSEALQIYFNTVGKHGYESGSFVEELVQNAPYYSIIDDTGYNMKLYVISTVIKHVANHLATKVKMLRNPADNPKAALIEFFTNRTGRFDLPTRRESKLKLANCLHKSMTSHSETLEYCIARLKYCSEAILVRFGKDAMYNDYDLLILGDMLIQTFVLITCIARASRSTFLHLENYNLENHLTGVFAAKTARNVQNLSSLIGQNYEELESFAEIGRKVFNSKNYFAEHPLMRNF